MTEYDMAGVYGSSCSPGACRILIGYAETRVSGERYVVGKDGENYQESPPDYQVTCTGYVIEHGTCAHCMKLSSFRCVNLMKV